MNGLSRILTAAVPALALVALAGCGPKENASEEPAKPGEPTTKKFVVGMSQCNLGEPWRVQMNADIKAAADEHPDEVEVVFKDASNKVEVQQSQVREFIQQHVDLIIISPKEARPLTQPVAEAMKAKIPVIVLDRKIEGDDYTCFIGGDNVQIGREAGKFLVRALNGKGTIVELQGLNTSTPAQERHQGFIEGIQGSELKVVFEADCKWLEPDAQREMASALSRFPQIDAVYAHNDPSAHGAYMAAVQEGKGREKTIKFVGIDALPHEGVRFVKEGLLSATFQYPTGGKDAIETALKVLKGEQVEKTITLGTRVFTKENAEAGGEEVK